METKIRILAADPNREFCRQLGELAAAEGDMELVGTAGDGIEALSLLGQLRPEVLLLELVLPKLDGLEVLRRLPDTGVDCRVIVLSGFVNGKVISDCSESGADYFMPKPCDVQILLSASGRSPTAPRRRPARVWTAASCPAPRVPTRISRRW